MKILKELFLLIYALIRVAIKWVFLFPLRLVPFFANIKAAIVSKYYRHKFPQLMQMRKIVGSEADKLNKELQQIRAEAVNAIIDHNHGLSKSQKKKRLANTHNAERLFMEKNRIKLVNGVMYQLDKQIQN